MAGVPAVPGVQLLPGGLRGAGGGAADPGAAHRH